MENIVQQLVAGQAEIDRMREEIDKVIWAIMGLVEEPSLFTESYIVFPVPDSEPNRWFVSTNKNWFTVSFQACTQRVDETIVTNSVGLWEIKFSKKEKLYVLNMENVQKAYEGLPVFINGMIRSFPKIKTRVDIILAAAKK